MKDFTEQGLDAIRDLCDGDSFGLGDILIERGGFRGGRDSAAALIRNARNPKQRDTLPFSYVVLLSHATGKHGCLLAFADAMGYSLQPKDTNDNQEQLLDRERELLAELTRVREHMRPNDLVVSTRFSCST